MPAETMHDGAQESGRAATPQLEVVEHVKGNIRSREVFEHGSERSDTYNSPAVDPENPYNAFAQAGEAQGGAEKPLASQEVQQEVLENLAVDVDALKTNVDALQTKNTEYENRIAELEAILRDTRELADVQPRRVRHLNGVTEQLVKYKNGSHVTFEWEPIPERERNAVEEPELEDEPATQEQDAPEETAAEASQEDEANESTTEDQEDAGETAEVADDVAPAEAEAEAGPAESEQESADDSESDDAEAEPEEESEKAPTFELLLTDSLRELDRKAVEARTKYAELTAKGRDGYVGRFLESSDRLAKIPMLKKLADKVNGYSRADKNIGEARQAYMQSISDLQVALSEQIQERYEESEARDAYILQEANKMAIDNDVAFETRVLEERTKRSGNTNAFVNWWVSHDTLGWKFTKAAGVAVAAIPVGMLAALGGVPALGVVTAAAGGAGLGAYINKKRAGAAEGSGTVADAHYAADGTRKGEYAMAQGREGKLVSVSELTDITEERTSSEKARNRTQVLSTAGAAAAGAMAGVGIQELGSSLSGAGEVQPDAGGDGGSGGEPEPEPTTEPEPTFEGNEFNVEDGNGYTQELVDFAETNGHQLTADQSYDLHKDLVRQFGPDYIDINGAGNDIYGSGVDVGLNEAGSAQWADGVGQYIQQWMTDRSLW